jgi:hypothetical protein
VSIDCEAFVDTYFWDTDFLLETSTYEQLGVPVKQQLGFRADVCGVVSGLLSQAVPAWGSLRANADGKCTSPYPVARSS